jgi:uncharacterized membrane protein YqhA
MRNSLDEELKNVIIFLKFTRSWMILPYITSVVLLIFVLYILKMVTEVTETCRC